MRVIAGTARRTPLRTLPGTDTRPTTDRIKETLFNTLQSYIADCKIMDLFSGSGALGIEALSRGAEFSFFVENNPEAVRCIKENLARTKLEASAWVCQADVLTGIHMAEQKGYVFDIILMDPPYRKGLEFDALSCLANSAACTEDTLVIVEAALDTDFGSVEGLGFIVERVKAYKTNQHVYMRKTAQLGT